MSGISSSHNEAEAAVETDQDDQGGATAASALSSAFSSPAASPASKTTPKQSKMAVLQTSMSKSPRSSGPPSPATSDISDELPTNVCQRDQLQLLPPECLSGDFERPLRHVDETSQVYHYALQPMFYSVIFILLIELLERFAFYGINYTQTSYLTGAYNEDWNAGMDAIPASTYVSISVAVAYTTPFLGAFLGDSLLGDYGAILTGALVFYLPGLFLIAFTTIPDFLGRQFNRTALSLALLGLWPIGTGIVKSIVNVYGAKQYHPLLQSALIEAYYVKFYMCINVGALVGGIVVPVWAQHNVTYAYFLPVAMLSLGTGLFILGSNRYVQSPPKNPIFLTKRQNGKYLHKQITPPPPPPMNGTTINLSVILRIVMLTCPFSIVYSQMCTTFILQGTVMQKFGSVDAASMNNADAVSVLVFGSLVGSHLYPCMARRGIKLPTTYKFAIGSMLGALSILWALMLESMIHTTYQRTGEKITILWQAMPYILIGAGEIFAISAAYEVAFTASPPEKKVLASALNLFCIGGVPNVFCIALYHLCSPWFRNSHGTTRISRIEDYTTAQVGKYFWVLFGISMVGVGINLLPAVRDFVASIEEKATDLLKSPKTPVPRPARRQQRILEEAAAATTADEESPLLRIKRHQAYLKYGDGPQLYKLPSMRAGASLSQRHDDHHLKRSTVQKMYKSEPVIPGVRGTTTVISKQGRPVMAGSLLGGGTGAGGSSSTGGRSQRPPREQTPTRSMPPREEEPLLGATSAAAAASGPAVIPRSNSMT